MLTGRIEGELTLRQQVQALRLPPAKRKRLNRRLAREVVKLSRQRIRSQTGLDGGRWTGRKNGKRKMLTRIMRGKNVKVLADARSGRISWPNRLMGQIARRHQEGIAETMTARRAARQAGTPNYDGPPSREMAKALVRAGFRIRAGKTKGGRVRTRRASQRWIMDNMTLGQAGLVLRKLSDQPSRQQWTIPIPERSFLGVGVNDKRRLAEILISQMTDRSKGR